MQTERRILLAASALVFGLACETPRPTTVPPGGDANIPRSDGSVEVPVRDAGSRDGGRGDAGRFDAGDAGPPPVALTIDGVVTDEEWARPGVVSAEASVPTTSPQFAGSQLRRVRALREGSRLYIALEGALADRAHAYLLYLDEDFGDGVGAILAGPVLADASGALDSALSAESLSATSELRVDYAWGSMEADYTRAVGDDRVGWRDVGTDTIDFRAIDNGTFSQTACRAGTCETFIRIGSGGLERAGDVVLFVRLGNGFGVLSNQTLPMDDPSSPETVGVFLRVP